MGYIGIMKNMVESTIGIILYDKPHSRTHIVAYASSVQRQDPQPLSSALQGAVAHEAPKKYRNRRTVTPGLQAKKIPTLGPKV